MKVVKTLSLQEQENLWLEKIAETEQKSQSAVVRDLIRKRAKELGLIKEGWQ